MMTKERAFFILENPSQFGYSMIQQAIKFMASTHFQR